MKNVKRALSLVIVLALALSMCVMGAGAVKYSDVESTYAYSAEVQFLSDLEIITGYPDGTFQPEGTITRAEAAAVIFRTLAGKESSSENYKGATDFVDVGVDHWACGYINFAVEMGIITGYPDGTFLPEKEISYAEYVTMLARALGLDIGKDLSYPYGYIAEATVENVNYGVDLAAAEPCSRGAVAKLTYNAILDATYRRIANNIYVTEKPTIAQNVLKLELMEGVVTSIDNYDWAGDNAVGEGYIRVTDADFADEDFEENDAEVWEYELDNSYLGKEVKVWYKPDAVTASGDKVYAVIEQKNTSMALPHIVLKGSLADDDDNEITFALNDVDYTAKLDDNCVFVENNEYIGDMNGIFTAAAGDSYTAKDFYPDWLRAWLPVMYNFIDNDADGKYEFVVRSTYGFAEVTGITSSRIGLEGIGSIDRKNDNGKAYDWNTGLEDVAEEDWVIFYADGAVSEGLVELRNDAYADLIAVLSDPGSTPEEKADATQEYTEILMGIFAAYSSADFDSDLYEDTNYATFQKMSFGTLAVDDILDHDRYVFDGTTYRTWTPGGEFYTELADGDVIEAEIGDEYELWYTNSFGGIIASAEAVDTSTGKFLVITEIDEDAFDPDRFSDDFEIKAVLASDDEEEIYTVKYDDEENFDVTHIAGTYEELEEAALAPENLVVGGLYEYEMNAKGQITYLELFTEKTYEDVLDGTDVLDYSEIDTSDYDEYYKAKSGKLYADPDSYVLADNAVVFVMEYSAAGEFDEANVYIGSVPKINIGAGDEAWVAGAKMKETSDDLEAKALLINVYSDDIGLSSGAEDDDILGYLRSVKRTGNADDGYYYEYTIAYGDDEAAVLKSRVGDDTDELEDIVDDDTLIDNAYWIEDMGKKASVVIFDITPDGTIANLEAVDAVDWNFGTDWGLYRENDEKLYFPTSVATSISNSKNRITADEVVGVALNPVAGSVDTLADAEEIFKLADDCTIFVFDMDSTNYAKVEIGSLGDIEEWKNDEGSIFSFAYDDDEGEITTIFVNGDVIE